MAILVTGGTGYIGSHTVVELLNGGRDVIIIDDFSNSKPTVLENIKEITNKNFKFYNENILNREVLDKIFKENNIDGVIHFAGYKAVDESVKNPLKYYENNVTGTITLLDVMKKYNVKKIIFSSSATVYGKYNQIPYKEEMQTGNITNPYGRSKYIMEEVLKDLYESDNDWNISILRYFNPIGSHKSGLIGDDPEGIPNNLMPYITRVANRILDELSIYGDDYDTKDGTCLRDYIHVVDLAIGHIKAYEKLDKEGKGLFIYNLGTGNPYSVLDIVNTFQEVNNIKVPYKFVEKRSGDLPICFADTCKTSNELNFKPKYSLEDMCKDSWDFQKT